MKGGDISRSRVPPFLVLLPISFFFCCMRRKHRDKKKSCFSPVFVPFLFFGGRKRELPSTANLMLALLPFDGKTKRLPFGDRQRGRERGEEGSQRFLSSLSFPFSFSYSGGFEVEAISQAAGWLAGYRLLPKIQRGRKRE